MPALHRPGQSAITAVIVLVVVVPALGFPVALSQGDVPPVNDTPGHGERDSLGCWLSSDSVLSGGSETATGVPLTDDVGSQNSSEHGGDLIVFRHGADGTITENNTTSLPVQLCHNEHGTARTGNQTLVEPWRITNATVEILNQTAREATNATDTVGHSVVGINETVDRVIHIPPGTERPDTTPLPESDDEPRDVIDEERTEPTPVERTTATEDRQQSTPTPSVNDTVSATTAQPTTPPATASSTTTPTTAPSTTTPTTAPSTTTPTTAPSTTTPTTASPTSSPSTSPATAETEQDPDVGTDASESTRLTVKFQPDDSDNSSTAPDGERPPFEPEPKTGVAVGLGAAAIRTVLKHGSAAPETVSGSSILSATVRTRLTTVIDSLSRSVVLLRYSRYDDSDPLEHGGRAVVFDAIEETPGIYLSAMRSHTDHSLSTLRHHLRVLEREELILSAKVHGKRRFYPVDTERIELTAALNEEATSNVIEALCHLGPATVSELADELDRDPSTVTHHLQRLEDDDIVRRKRSGRVVMNCLVEDVRTHLTEQPGERSARSNAD